MVDATAAGSFAVALAALAAALLPGEADRRVGKTRLRMSRQGSFVRPSLPVTTFAPPSVVSFAPVAAGRKPMDYRLYSHDGSRMIMHIDDFEARSDLEAIRIARSMKKSINCELWSLDRLVARIPAGR